MTQIRRLARCGLLVALAVVVLLTGVMPVGALTEWGPLGAGLGGTRVLYLQVWDGKLVAAGDFSSAGGTPANHIAIWDGTQWAPLADGWDVVRGVATHNGQLVVVGYRAGSVDWETAGWNGAEWTTIAQNPYGWPTGFNGKLYQARVFASGNARQADVYEYDGATWTLIRSWWSSEFSFALNLMTVIDSSLYVHVGPLGELDSYDGSSWTSYGSGDAWAVRRVARVNGQLYAGGNTTSFPVLSRWTGTAWDRIYSSVECGLIGTLAEFGGKLIVAGGFNAACGPPYTRVASWDGAAWDSVGTNMNSGVSVFAVYEGKLIAAGSFTEAGGVPISLIAQLNDVPTPVAISGFTAKHHGEGVELAWEIAADEVFDGFYVYRSESGDTDELVNSSILAPDVRSYVDHSAQPATRYSYFLVAVGAASGEVRSPRVEIALPAVTATLLQNAPNPFNPATRIRFVVPGNDHVSIDIYSPAGQKVRALVNTTFPPGKQSTTWDGTDDNGQRVASGVYLYRMRIGRVEQSKKMILLK